MSFQSAQGNVQVTEEPVIKKEAIPANEVPVFDSDNKLKSSGVNINSISPESSIINAIIFG
jgi:hypothetical protein